MPETWIPRPLKNMDFYPLAKSTHNKLEGGEMNCILFSVFTL